MITPCAQRRVRLWIGSRSEEHGVGMLRKLKKRLARHDELAKSTTAVAGLTTAASVVAGTAAAAAAPTGLSAAAVALGLTSAPLIVTIAPVVCGVAAVAGSVAGVVRFYSWCKDLSSESDTTLSQHETTPESEQS